MMLTLKRLEAFIASAPTNGTCSKQKPVTMPSTIFSGAVSSGAMEEFDSLPSSISWRLNSLFKSSIRLLSGGVDWVVIVLVYLLGQPFETLHPRQFFRSFLILPLNHKS